MAKYRFKTEQEFKDKGLWRSDGYPNTWNSGKKMNQYLGDDIPDKFNEKCDAGKIIEIENWAFNSDSYTLSSLVGRYVKYAKWTPSNPYLRSSNGYDKIIEDIPEKDTIELECYATCSRTRLTDGDLELMAIGFTPFTDSSIPLQKQDLAGRWIKWNVEVTRKTLTYKIGDYSQIKKIDFVEEIVYLHGDTGHFTSVRLVDGDWEILPEGFTPIVEQSSSLTNSLPEKWCVKVEGPSTEPRYAELVSWRIHPWRNPGYIHCDMFHDFAIQPEYTEITLEDFKKLVCKIVGDLPTPQSKGSAYSEYVSKEGDTITIGKLKTLVCNNYQGYWLDNSAGSISKIYEQFGLKKDQLTDFLGYSNGGTFPYCKTIDDLNRLIGFIKSKEASSSVMTDTAAADSPGSVNRNLAILCSSKQQVQSIFDKLKSLGEQKDPINLSYTPQWCYIIYTNEGGYNGWYLALTSDLGERTVIDGDKFLGASPSTAIESSSATSSLSSFPAEGCYELSEPKVQELLSLLQDTRPSPASKNTYDVIVAWNSRSYWYVSTMSGKPRYTYANLSPFLDTQSGESFSPKIDSSSSDTPSFIKNKWYKNLGDSGNYAGCFDYIEGKRFYLKEYYDFTNNVFYKGQSSWLSCENAVECTEEDLKVIFVLNPTENPMYKESSKFIVGKWYSYNKWYIKFANYDGDIFHSSEEINSSGNYIKVIGRFGGHHEDHKRKLIEDLSVIQHYLPDGHPDKIVHSGTPTVDLLEEAKKKYPIGTKGNNNNLGIGYSFVITGTNFEYAGDGSIRVNAGSTSIGAYRTVYKKGEWAEITYTPLNSSVFPEYVEAVESTGNAYTKGKIYKTTSDSSSTHYCTIDDQGRKNGWNAKNFKASTKEAYDKQNMATTTTSAFDLNTFIKIESNDQVEKVYSYLKSKGEKVHREYTYVPVSWCYIAFRAKENAWGITGLHNDNNLSSSPKVVTVEDFLPTYVSSSSSTCPFKEGDKIIGISEEVYGVTVKGWIGEVLKTYLPSPEDIKVGGLGDFKRGPFTVNSKHFRLATAEEIRQGKCLETLDRRKESTESIINVAKGDLPQTIKVKDRPII